jgi:hypothetical protein
MSTQISFQPNNPIWIDLIQDQCCATQSKVKNDQCKNKRKEHSIFCGVHSTCNAERIYAPLFNLFYPKNKSSDQNQSQEYHSFDMIVDSEDNQNDITIESDDHLRSLILNNRLQLVSVTILRNYIKNHIQLKNIIQTKGSKNSMIQELKKYYESIDLYSSQVNKIILVQSIVRRWSILRRSVCSNQTDILSMDSIYEIPRSYFYIFEDKKSKTNAKYGYDIRTFTKILYDPMNNPKFVAKCPYTSRPFEIDEIVTIEKYIEKLKSSGISLEIEKPKLSKEKEIELKCVDIFLRMDMLDNYTQSSWFMNLDVNKLLIFYDTARDIWNYRIQMPIKNKLRILSNGRAFEMPRHFLAKLPSKLALQNFILIEIERFITEGINREEKKLGAMLMLTALVEVSPEAASALPHLVQSF